MRPQDLARLVALAAMWGGSYLFMRYALPHLGAVPMIEARVVIAGIALAAMIYATGGAIGWREHWRAFAFVGAVGMALPFVLIAQALYGYTIVFTKVKLKGASPMGTSAGTLLVAALALLAFTPGGRMNTDSSGLSYAHRCARENMICRGMTFSSVFIRLYPCSSVFQRFAAPASPNAQQTSQRDEPVPAAARG